MFRGFYAKKIDILNIVFDVDCTLLTGSDPELPKWKELLEEYRKCNLVLETTHYAYIIHPGVLELIRFLDAIPYVNISFFSSKRDKNENARRVEELMCRAVGEERYNLVKHLTKIGCYDDIVKVSSESSWLQVADFGLSFAEYKKDIQKFLNLTKEDLRWAVLVDDDETYVALGEEKNILRVLVLDDFHFEGFKLYGRRKSDFEYFFRMNHIFYIAGVLQTILNRVKTENKKPCDILFEMHYDKVSVVENGETKIKYKFNKNIKQFFSDPNLLMSYYELGLETLRKVNPDLHFFTYKNFYGNSNFQNTRPSSIVLNI